jgi:hypothetical protein
MVNVRSGIVAASYPGRNSVKSVTLGTAYPSRVFGLNPAPPSGRLTTTASEGLSVNGGSNACPGDEETRALRYEPGYNEFDAPTTVYEHSFIYNQAPSGEAVLSGQSLYFDSSSNEGTINLIALRNDFSASGTDAESVELVHGATRETKSVSGPVTVTLPTYIEDRSTWEQIVENMNANDDNEEAKPVSIDIISFDQGNQIKLKFSGNETFDILCTPVGVGGAPPEGAANLAPPSVDSLPSDAVAYDDLNKNREYDSGETTYKDSEFDGGGRDFSGDDVDLVIARDVTRSDGNGLSIKADSIKVDSGVTVRSDNGDVELIAGDGEIGVEDANIEGNNLDLKAATNSGIGDIRATGARLETSGSNVQVTVNSGTFYVNDNGGTEADGGTYIVEDDDTDNTATLNAGSVSGSPEKGMIS